MKTKRLKINYQNTLWSCEICKRCIIYYSDRAGRGDGAGPHTSQRGTHRGHPGDLFLIFHTITNSFS